MADKYYINQDLYAAIVDVIRKEMSRHKNSPNPLSGVGRHERLPIRRFKLTATLSLGGSAAAVFRYRDPDTGTIADSSDTLTVYDAEDMFEGDSGTYGKCVLMIDGPTARWEVIQLGCG